MRKPNRPLSLDAFALRIALAGFGSVLAAVLMLGVLVTPAHRGGGPLLDGVVRPFFESIGLWPENRRLKGENPRARQDETTIGSIRFLVRFENEPVAEAALRLFRENRGNGRKAFRSWAAETEAFQDFELAAMTPSGEAVLVYQKNVEAASTQRDLVRLKKRLSDTPGVAYADPYPFLPASSG